jgi:hypothetical protein
MANDAYRENYKQIDWSKATSMQPRSVTVKFGDAPVVMGDITPFRTIDGVEISSRSHLRAYEQANGVRQVGNDFNSHFGINKR